MDQDTMAERILQAAQAEFAKTGFHKTVVSDIARRAGVGKGTVYRRFGNKEALFSALTTWAIGQLQEQIDQVCNQSLSSRQALQEVLRIHFSVFEHSREIVEIVVMEGMQISGLSREELSTGVTRIKDKLQELFARGINQGEFWPYDPNKLAFLFQGFVWSMLKSAILYNMHEPGRDYESFMLEVFLHGIAVQNPPGRLQQGE